MRFSEIVGHDRIRETLSRVIAVDRPVNAYLFCGPEGVGKRSTALRFAAGLLCGARGERPCGVCSSCVQVETGNHPDLITVKPEPKKKNISVDVVRDVIAEEAYVRPYLGPYKIIYIPEGDLLLPPAQNALLKVLEEPPPNVLFLATATDEDAFLPTVRSRAQVISFHPLAQSDVEAYLRKARPGLGAELSFVASFSEGSIGRALDLADDGAALEERRFTVDRLRRMADGDSVAAYELIADVGEKKDARLTYALRLLVAWFRDALLLQNGTDAGLVNRDIRDEVARFAQKTSGRRLARALDRLLGLERLMKTNANMATASADVLLNIWEDMHEEGNRRSI